MAIGSDILDKGQKTLQVISGTLSIENSFRLQRTKVVGNLLCNATLFYGLYNVNVIQ